MATSRKKRFNAFEDFPASQKKSIGTQPVISQDASEIAKVERIERLRPSQMIPDRFQPRRLLPIHIRQEFFANRIDCYQAAAEWLKFAHQDSGVRSEVDKLIALGSSFDDHGQIKAITGSWQSDASGNYQFLIETGERRFWAACLQHVATKAEKEPLLRVEVVEKPTRQRQVIENRHSEAPSAVEQACEVAALILAELGIQPDSSSPDDYDYFRLARAQRMPAGLWDRITPIMQLTRPRMVQLLNILQFPSPLLDKADRFRLPERVLREILNQPQNHWELLIHQSIQNALTSEDINQVVSVESGTKDVKRVASAPDPLEKTAYRTFRRFTRVFRNIGHLQQSEILDALADDLMVRDQAKQAVDILNELLTLLQARLSRK